eukprot:scaffold194_cov277-Pinguiococcus_pyrenoidosus.AAC.5
MKTGDFDARDEARVSREAEREDGKGGDDEKEELDEQADLKIILLGDSAVGKSKLVERYMMGDYCPRRMSTYALTTHHKEVVVTGDDGETQTLRVEFWDTAGQEHFNTMHPAYYHRAHGCLMVFDVTRKMTYQHLAEWFGELRSYCEDIPVILVANKIDVDYKVREETRGSESSSIVRD